MGHLNVKHSCTGHRRRVGRVPGPGPRGRQRLDRPRRHRRLCRRRFHLGDRRPRRLFLRGHLTGNVLGPGQPDRLRRTWTFTFKAAAFSAASANITGSRAVDNNAALHPNGTLVAELLGNAATNDNAPRRFASAAGSVINGVNTVTLVATNTGGPAGMWVAAGLNADPITTAPVPLPATGALPFGGRAGLAALGRCRGA